MYHLSNTLLQVSITALGAELQNIFHTGTQHEYMWEGDPNFWGKKSPVLFPIVGGLKNNTYQYQGQSYAMSRHGFAREKTFTVTQQSDDEICFSLEADTDTQKIFPFLFRFSVIYRLHKNTLTVSYLVENIDDKNLYFSVGAHPAFKMPLVAGTAYTDYQLVFNQPENAGQWPLSAEGLIEGKSLHLLHDENRLALSKELFYGDALVFKSLASTSISILSNKTTHGLTLSYEGFPYMGIWSAKDANFVCIEPWCGIADSVDSNGDITKKEGIHSLAANQTFSRTWQVTVF